MDFFTCNQCKRCCRRRTSSGDEENDETATGYRLRHRAAVRRVSGRDDETEGRMTFADCCASAMLYFYAVTAATGRWRPDTSGVDGNRRPRNENGRTDRLELPGRSHRLQSLQRKSPIASSSGTSPRGSILKNSSSSTLEIGNNIGAVNAAGSSLLNLFHEQSEIRRSSSPEKRTSFKEAVDVIVPDETGYDVVTNSVRLKPPSVTGLSSVDDELKGEGSRRRGRHQCGGDLAALSDRIKQGKQTPTGSGIGRKVASPAYVYPPASRCRHAFSLASTNVERRSDGCRYLRAVIRPTSATSGFDDGVMTSLSTPSTSGVWPISTVIATGRHHQKPRGSVTTGDMVVVRAAAKGSRLVVGAYRPEPLGDGTNYMRQYVDRFPLPHSIETHTIRADIEPTGELIVTAVINDSSDSD